MRGGSSNNDTYCGIFIIHIYRVNSWYGYNISACLSFKLIEYFYCDYLYQGSGVKYTTRGGAFNVGLFCGTFGIGLGGAFNYAGTQIGASISFKIYEFLL